MKSLTFVVPIGIVSAGTLWYLLQPNESGVRFQAASCTVLSAASGVAFCDILARKVLSQQSEGELPLLD